MLNYSSANVSHAINSQMLRYGLPEYNLYAAAVALQPTIFDASYKEFKNNEYNVLKQREV